MIIFLILGVSIAMLGIGIAIGKYIQQPIKVVELPPDNTNNKWMFTGNASYDIQYRITLKLENGSLRETGVINVTIPANDAAEAKNKLRKFVRENIQPTVLSIKENKSKQ